MRQAIGSPRHGLKPFSSIGPPSARQLPNVPFSIRSRASCTWLSIVRSVSTFQSCSSFRSLLTLSSPASLGTYTQEGGARLDWGRGAAEGSWRITAGKFCTKYKGIRDEKERCFTIYKTGENEYKAFLPDGTFHGTTSFIH
jgi:hypothetical protein